MEAAAAAIQLGCTEQCNLQTKKAQVTITGCKIPCKTSAVIFYVKVSWNK